jgi:acetyl esterase/lipase
MNAVFVLPLPMMKKILYILSIPFLMACSRLPAQEVIRLYEGVAPGSESWDWEEQDFGPVVFNTIHPTLTVLRPKRTNGIGVVVCPGGGFISQAIGQEGLSFGRQLTDKGFTVFVLKYRIGHISLQDLKDNDESENWALMMKCGAETVPLATQDGLTAMRHVRSHAADYGIDPDKIGIQGSSAGGTIALSVALSARNTISRPDFVIDCYGFWPLVQKVSEPSMPLFITAAMDDTTVGVRENAEETFYFWQEAGAPVELHLFERGEHGFVGKEPQGLPVDDWTTPLFHWIDSLFQF